jgi:hypothetical protein
MSDSPLPVTELKVGILEKEIQNRALAEVQCEGFVFVELEQRKHFRILLPSLCLAA